MLLNNHYTNLGLDFVAASGKRWKCYQLVNKTTGYAEVTADFVDGKIYRFHYCGMKLRDAWNWLSEVTE